jgi:hypothetical protein
LIAIGRDAIAKLYEIFRDLDRWIQTFDKKIEQVFRNREHCQRSAIRTRFLCRPASGPEIVEVDNREARHEGG